VFFTINEEEKMKRRREKRRIWINVKMKI